MDHVESLKYSRHFVNDTQTGEDGYPVYRRRDVEDGGQTATLNIRGSRFIRDNRWIVPYSPLMCRAINGHINVKYWHSVQAIDYICKINKGSDQATPWAASNRALLLAVQLENGQTVYFTRITAEQVDQNPRKTDENNEYNEFAQTLLYHQVPQYYAWANNKFWRRRRGEDVLGHPGI